jgi:hypothetical protein
VKYPDFKGNEPCTEIGPEMFCASPQGVSRPYVGIEILREACARCDMLAECREWSLHHEGNSGGFWAGMSPTERSTERRRLNILLEDPIARYFPQERERATA